MPDFLGEDMRKEKKGTDEKEEEIKGMDIFVYITVCLLIYAVILWEMSSHERDISDFTFLALDEGDIAVLKSYVSLLIPFRSAYRYIDSSMFQGQGPYHQQIKRTEDDVQQCLKRVNELTGKFLIRTS